VSETNDIYKGEYKDGKYNGKGNLRYSNGNIYEGEWKNGKRDGKGIMRFGDGKLKGEKYEYESTITETVIDIMVNGKMA